VLASVASRWWAATPPSLRVPRALESDLRVISIAWAKTIQLIGLLASALLGVVAGLAFALGTARPWLTTHTTFLWMLIIGLVVVIVAFASGRIARGDLRRGVLHSAAVFFGQTTLYLGVLLALAALGASQPAIGDLVPALYGSSATMVLATGPFFLGRRHGKQ
jgi:hypothetical protein